MSAGLLFSFVIGYFALLLVVAWILPAIPITILQQPQRNWMLVVFGKIGTSLSGVTFVR
jgi:hypothetical protein